MNINVIKYFFLFVFAYILASCEIPLQKSKLTELMQSVIAEDIDLVRQLLDNHVDMNARREGGYTALMFASGAHLHDSERQLTQLGITVPSLKIREQILRLLLEKGADPNLQLLSGERALIFAIYHGRVRSVKDLLRAKAYVNFIIREGKGWSPLMLATYHCYLDIIELLLINGADQNLRNTDGESAKTIALEECPNAFKLFDK